MTEAAFHDLVAAWLADSFAEVDHEPRVDLPDDAPDAWVEPDFVAHTPFSTYAIEVEDGHDTLEQGIGQAIRYATLLDATPVLVLPADAWPGRSRFGPVAVETV